MREEIIYEDLPRVYQLHWNAEEKKIVCLLHNSVLPTLYLLNKEHPVVLEVIETGKFDNFYNEPTDSRYGFNGCFEVKKTDLQQDITTFEARIPQTYKQVGACQSCEGTGEGNDPDGNCMWCDGTKFEWERDTTSVEAISVSLNFLLMSGAFLTECTNSKKNQLLNLYLHGGFLGGHLSDALIKWLSDGGEEFFYKNIAPGIITAMKNAYTELHPNYKIVNRLSFRAELYDGWRLIIDCPGNACGIHPVRQDRNGDEKGVGYQFDSHNVDSIIQQLVLVVGLAKLSDLYEEHQKPASG